MVDIDIIITILEKFGITVGFAYIFYLLLRIMINRSFVQSDAMMELAKGLIRDNIAAMGNMHEAIKQMNDGLIAHTNQKDKLIEAIEEQTETFVTQMKDCKNGRDKKLAEILRKQ
jgi:uncharacterized membrane protein